MTTKDSLPVRPASSRASSHSYMDTRIEKHWNDAIIPRKMSRNPTPIQHISSSQLRERLDDLYALPSRLSPSQIKIHKDKIEESIHSIDPDQRSDIYEALGEPTPEGKRKKIVEFIRTHEGVVRWASSLRNLAEST